MSIKKLGDVKTILVAAIALVFSATSFASSSDVYAFCLFNCAAEDLKNRLQANVDCLKNQISMGNPGRTAYGTEDLDAEGKKVQIGTQWYTEEELRKDWKENPESRIKLLFHC